MKLKTCYRFQVSTVSLETDFIHVEAVFSFL